VLTVEQSDALREGTIKTQPTVDRKQFDRAIREYREALDQWNRAGRRWNRVTGWRW
jgi:hypothetical protein